MTRALAVFLSILVIGSTRSGVSRADVSDQVRTLTPIDRCGVPEFRERIQADGAQVVIVGVNDCSDPAVAPRKFAESDAKALYELFLNRDYFGAPVKQVQLLLGHTAGMPKAKLATRANIIAALKQAASSTGDDDLLIFVYIGQGTSLGVNGSQVCYFGFDSTLAGRATNTVTDMDLAREFNRVGSPRVCAFIDANFNGRDDRDPVIPDPDPGAFTFRSIGGRERGGSRYLSGRAIFLAADQFATTPNLADQGIFTRALLDGLKGAADSESTDPDGLVTIYELSKYLTKHYPDLAATLTTKGSKRLQPFSGYGIHSDFPIALNPVTAKTTEATVRRFDELAKTQGLDRTLVQEGRHLLGRSPTIDTERELRKLYLSFVSANSRSAATTLSTGRAAIFKRAELPQAEAEKFADTVLKAIGLLDREYVRRLNAGELVGWGIAGLYQRIDESMPELLETQIRRLKTVTGPALRTFLIDSRKAIGRREDLAGHGDIDNALQAMLGRLDSQSGYITPKFAEQESERLLNQNFVGIGVVIMADPDSDYIIVKTPIKGSPAHKAGLQSDDLITSVRAEFDAEGNPLKVPEITSAKGLTVAKISEKLIGKPGTPIKVSVLKPGGRTDVLTISRGRIEMETVVGSRRQPNGDWLYKLDDAPGIGYVRLTAFGTRTLDELKAVVESLKSQGLRGLILDLRFNGGGILQACIDVADLFIDDETIVTIHNRVGGDQVLKGHKEGSLTGFPMVCLVNKGTASGSEIIAAALQHHGRATILGEHTYGLGNVRTFREFDGGRIQFVISTFVGPNGRNLDRESAGNLPDEWGVFPSMEAEYKLTPKNRDLLQTHFNDLERFPRTDGLGKPITSNFQDKQLDMALRYLVARANKR